MKEYNSTFRDLLSRDNSISIHNINVQALAIELFKIVNGITPEIMKDVFQLKGQGMYCSSFPFKNRNIRTTKYGMKTLSHLGAKKWDQIPEDIKGAKSLKSFKDKLWAPNKCQYRFRKIYIANLGFVDTTASYATHM